MIYRVVILLAVLALWTTSAIASEAMEIKAEPYVKTNTRVGQLAFFKTYQQSFKSAGNVIELSLEEGQTFKKGDVLAKVDTDDLSSELNQLIAEKAFVNKEIERLKKLKKVNAVSQSDVDRQKSRSSQLRAQIIRTREFLDAALIVAPFDGVVISRYIDAGEFVNAGQAVISIAPVADNLVVEVAVQDQLLMHLAVGQKIMLENRSSDAKLLGEVKTVPQMPEANTGLFVVKIMITDTENTRVGSLYNVTLTQSMNMVYPIPADYVQLDFNQTAILMLNNDGKKATPKRLKVIDHNSEYVYVKADSQSSINIVKMD
ncbi:efflux RND transporter periplasmic adaptor subunit [Psychrosphaera aestuarii]|uniref:efflux RND transporter periplasmic adaptor subunit n=1 Tax=Psychrosphaera aestuarii TaxID=1266052 RepID=UPI001B32BCAB|nr:efflux RND transporter periplasmic adaptor subunit [Psychrosphaera aestuarii]